MQIVLFIAVYMAWAGMGLAQDPDSFARVADQLLPKEDDPPRSAVRPMTLEEIENVALETNPQIRLMSERLARSRAQVSGSLSLPDPMFMYRAWGPPLTEPWNLNGAQHMFMFSQTLPASGKRELRFKAVNENVESAEAELEGTKQDVLMQVRIAFYTLLRNYDELKLYGEQSALARQAVSTARTRYVVGQVAQYEVLKAQVALTQLADRLVRFRQDGDLARLALNALMDRLPASPLEIAGAYALPADLPDAGQLQKLALDNRPELRALAASIQSSQTMARLAARDRKPDITISTGFMLMPAGAPKRGAYMAEVSLPLPWLNRSKHDAEIDEAQAEVRVRQAGLDARKAFVFQEIEEARIRTTAAKQLVDLYRKTLRPQAEATLRAATAAYQTDRADFLSVIESQNAALDVEYSYYRALTEFDARLAEMERAVGTTILRNTLTDQEAADDEE